MRFRAANPLRWRCGVATTVETTVAMFTTMLVTVFFVALLVFPETGHAHTARDSAWSTVSAELSI
jgi:hypothetical protein